LPDIGADTLKPMFIAMSAVTVVTFDLAFIFERYLRHTGKLAPNTSVWQKVYSACATIAAIVGAAGLILLTIFDTKRHNKLHNIFLGVFILGYVVSAIFICWEYQRLGIHYRQHSVLRISFWIKLFFIIAEVCLAIAFGVCSKKHIWNVAAVLEWIVAFIYCIYVISYFVDFLPALRTKNGQSYQTEMQMAEEGHRGMGDGAADENYFRGSATSTVPVTNGYTNGDVNFNPPYGHQNGNGYVSHTADGYPKPAVPLSASRNF
jgi:hypothetical protein